MENILTLVNSTEFNIPLQAKFSSLHGMNLMSFMQGTTEILDQTTRNLFTQRCAGLGALIGPHFHHRAKEAIPPCLFDYSLFPHLEGEKKTNQTLPLEPFSHGIARYVPWKVEYSNTQINAKLSGNDLYKNIAVKNLEGQNFEMVFDVKLVHDGLLLNLTITSEKPSVIGFHYYYSCPPNSFIQSLVHPVYRNQTGWETLPSEWLRSKHLHFDLSQEADFGFKPQACTEHPYYTIILHTPSYQVHLEYTSSNSESTSWQLYRPKNSSFVCIEPLSALNPREPLIN
ncbi:MAG: hypothetical protein WCG10_08355, partial [Chlamydiota bacterium]